MINNIFKIIILLYLTFLMQNSNAEKSQTKAKETTDNRLKASKIIDQITGVYKYRFKNYFISGESFQSENILEIVKINDNTIYFRTELTFSNNHACSLFGTAAYKDDTLFLYEDKNNACKLTINITDKDINFLDGDGNNDQCKENYCGTRGGFSGISFKKSQRRDIRYMKILKNSQEYKDSIEELNFQAQ